MHDRKFKDRRPKTWADDEDSEYQVKPAIEGDTAAREVVYETTNLCLAATLSLSFEVVDAKKGEVSIRFGKPFYPAIFMFKDTPELQAAIEDYWGDRTRVNPIAFYRQLQNLRSRTHELLK